jgi:DNA replication protein DnaC
LVNKDSNKDFQSLQKQVDLSSMFDNRQFFNPYTYYFKLYQRFPHRHWYKDVNQTQLLNKLGAEYDLSKAAVFETRIHSREKYKHLPGVSTYILSEGLMLCLPPVEFGSNNDAQVYYSDNVKKTELKKVLEIVESCFMPREAEKREIFLLMQDKDSKLDFFPMQIQNTEVNLEYYYNDDFLSFSETLVKRLNEDEKGLVIFYGKPGTGKTTYIRYLSAHVKKQKLFVPASLIHKIGSAEFLSLLKDYKNSLLILEDADAILRRRNSDEEQVISNLLNLADGMLSEFYHVQIICTFSKEINQVDPGMIRKGRLLASYNFMELSKEKTALLFNYLGYKEVPDHEMTLADVLNYRQGESGLNRKSQIGF